MDEYTKKIVEYINNPKFQGKIKNPTHTLSLKSSECGDWNDIHLEVKEKKIINISYENSGCSLNIASLEIICKNLLSKDLENIKKINPELIEKELDYPKHKEHCIKLVIDTLNKVGN